MSAKAFKQLLLTKAAAEAIIMQFDSELSLGKWQLLASYCTRTQASSRKRYHEGCSSQPWGEAKLGGHLNSCHDQEVAYAAIGDTVRLPWIFPTASPGPAKSERESQDHLQRIEPICIRQDRLAPHEGMHKMLIYANGNHIPWAPHI